MPQELQGWGTSTSTSTEDSQTWPHGGPPPQLSLTPQLGPASPGFPSSPRGLRASSSTSCCFLLSAFAACSFRSLFSCAGGHRARDPQPSRDDRSLALRGDSSCSAEVGEGLRPGPPSGRG